MRLLPFSFALLILVSSSVLAQDRSLITGLSAVGVFVHAPDRAFQNEIDKTVRAKLSHAGIAILGDGATGDALLVVTVKTASVRGIPNLAALARVEVKGPAHVARNRAYILGTLWQSEFVLIVRDPSKEIAMVLDVLIDGFIKEYREANPRRGGVGQR